MSTGEFTMTSEMAKNEQRARYAFLAAGGTLASSSETDSTGHLR